MADNVFAPAPDFFDFLGHNFFLYVLSATFSGVLMKGLIFFTFHEVLGRVTILLIQYGVFFCVFVGN